MKGSKCRRMERGDETNHKTITQAQIVCLMQQSEMIEDLIKDLASGNYTWEGQRSKYS